MTSNPECIFIFDVIQYQFRKHFEAFISIVDCCWWLTANVVICLAHYCDVIMGAVASQITSLTIVYSTVYSDADQSKHQSSASLAFVRSPVNSPHKWPVTQKMFPFDDVIMNSECCHLSTRSGPPPLVMSAVNDCKLAKLDWNKIQSQKTCSHIVFFFLHFEHIYWYPLNTLKWHVY